LASFIQRDQTRNLCGGPFIISGNQHRIERGLPMSSLSFRSSQPDRWTMPRPHQDAGTRYRIYGPVLPMEERRGFLARLLRRP
jgi:hypothetical protein